MVDLSVGVVVCIAMIGGAGCGIGVGICEAFFRYVKLGKLAIDIERREEAINTAERGRSSKCDPLSVDIEVRGVGEIESARKAINALSDSMERFLEVESRTVTKVGE